MPASRALDELHLKQSNGFSQMSARFALAVALPLSAAACQDPDGSYASVDIAANDKGGTESGVDKAAATRYEAEASSSQTGCATATNHSGYSGSGFIDFGGNGTLVEWNDINAPASGTYRLAFRYANASSAARRAAITVNGIDAGAVQFEGTGSWKTWNTATIDVSLHAGHNTIRVTASTSNGGPNLDYVDVALLSTDAGESGLCVAADEGDSAQLSCPSGQTISRIVFASYGTPSGTCRALETGSCDAQDSQSVVEAGCIGKNACTVDATNAMFGDPCAGTYKRLSVAFECETAPDTGGGLNPYCGGTPSGEDASKREAGTLTFDNRSVAYELRGGLISPHTPNACVTTGVVDGQTQVLMQGTSDGGCTTCEVGLPVDRTLMENQGFSLVRIEGDQDARTEMWARVYDSQDSRHRSTIAITGNSNAVAWVLATIDTPLDTRALAANSVGSGSGRSLQQDGTTDRGWLYMKTGTSHNNLDMQRKQFQIKFAAFFLDDSCGFIGDTNRNQMIPFWDQGDGDTFVAGVWGVGQNVPDTIYFQRLEDWGFDVAMVAAGQNP